MEHKATLNEVIKADVVLVRSVKFSQKQLVDVRTEIVSKADQC